MRKGLRRGSQQTRCNAARHALRARVCAGRASQQARTGRDSLLRSGGLRVRKNRTLILHPMLGLRMRTRARSAEYRTGVHTCHRAVTGANTFVFKGCYSGPGSFGRKASAAQHPAAQQVPIQEPAFLYSTRSGVTCHPYSRCEASLSIRHRHHR